MSDGASKFGCDGCGRIYTWKPELAGRRVKCKCGEVMTVREAAPEPEPEPQDDGMYDFADIASADAAAAQRATESADAAGPVEPVSRPRAAVATTGAGGSNPRALPKSAAATLGYQRGPTQREKERIAGGNSAIIDMNRDAYVPAALLVIGLLIYVLQYAMKYHLGGAGIAAVSGGLFIMTLFKAALLIGFALVAAGPLGVSFGGIFTAALKLAAIAVFSDGVTAWVDAGVAKASGTAAFGGGGFGMSMISFPIALGIYWGLLIYLFSMDPGDSWMVVIVLSVFDYIVRTVLMLLLLSMVLSWGGVASSAVPSFGGGGSGGSSKVVSETTQHVEELKDAKALREARAYIAGGRKDFLKQTVEDFYAAGAKDVSFSVSWDINHRETAEELIIEMPKDKAGRTKCYEIRKRVYTDMKWGFDPDEMKDDGEPYMMMRIE